MKLAIKVLNLSNKHLIFSLLERVFKRQAGRKKGKHILFTSFMHMHTVTIKKLGKCYNHQKVQLQWALTHSLSCLVIHCLVAQKSSLAVRSFSHQESHVFSRYWASLSCLVPMGVLRSYRYSSANEDVTLCGTEQKVRVLTIRSLAL